MSPSAQQVRDAIPGLPRKFATCQNSNTPQYKDRPRAPRVRYPSSETLVKVVRPLAAMAGSLRRLVDMFTIRKILVGTDFSPPSDAALDYAINLASRLGASVAVLHTYEIPVYGVSDGIFVVTPEMVAQIRAASQKALDAAVAKCKDPGAPMDVCLREGRAWETIHATAAELGADLIVIGTHGRKGFARALLGSVAEKIIRTATVPVLAVHSQPGAGERPVPSHFDREKGNSVAPAVR
jgi:nucleotide-binding universal stress UspA family protein